MSAGASNSGDASEDLNDVAESIVDEIQRPKQASEDAFKSRGADVWLPTMDLPGFGDAYDSCGEDIPHFCEDCGDSFAVGRTCKRSVCSRCAPAWVLDRAPGIVGRLDTIARVMSSRRDEPVYKHHIVFSPPDDWALEADDVLDRTQKVIRRILNVMNAEGMVAYHPWAGADHLEGDDRGEWKKRLFNDRDWQGDVRDELMPRGHFHAIVASPHIPGGETIAQINRETDWVIKRVTKRDGSGRSLDGLEDVANAVTYALSHTGIDTDGETNQAAYTKFGSLWHDRSINVFDDVEEAADVAVREVAPRTLGIPAKAVRCGREVAEDDRDGAGVDAYRNLTAPQGDGQEPPEPDDFGPEPGSSTVEVDGAGDDVELVPCAGRVLPIDKAPDYLDRKEWVAQASKADELREVWQEWQEGDGWPDDDPPPD